MVVCPVINSTSQGSKEVKQIKEGHCSLQFQWENKEKALMGVCLKYMPLLGLQWKSWQINCQKELESDENRANVHINLSFQSSVFSTPELRLLRTDELSTFSNSESPLSTAPIKNYALVLPLLFSTEQTSTRRKLVCSLVAETFFRFRVREV